MNRFTEKKVGKKEKAQPYWAGPPGNACGRRLAEQHTERPIGAPDFLGYSLNSGHRRRISQRRPTRARPVRRATFVVSKSMHPSNYAFLCPSRPDLPPLARCPLNPHLAATF
jgi:hypothetical protein